jgi:hypothetical protein
LTDNGGGTTLQRVGNKMVAVGRLTLDRHEHSTSPDFLRPVMNGANVGLWYEYVVFGVSCPLSRLNTLGGGPFGRSGDAAEPHRLNRCD